MEKLVAPKVSGNMPKAKEDSCNNPYISDSECSFQFILDKSPEKDFLCNNQQRTSDKYTYLYFSSPVNIEKR